MIEIIEFSVSTGNSVGGGQVRQQLSPVASAALSEGPLERERTSTSRRNEKVLQRRRVPDHIGPGTAYHQRLHRLHKRSQIQQFLVQFG